MSLLTRAKHVVRPIIGDLPNRIHRRRRDRELAASRTTVSLERLVTDLDRLPIRPGAAALVHSSLKSLGYVDGGADAVVQALIELFVRRRGGTVMLPAFSIDGSMHQTLVSGRCFDLHATPSNLGKIPEAFRRHPEARRSLHPTHSIAAIGEMAATFIADHQLARSSFGKGSPMAKLLDADGYLLGLGTDLGKVTFYHCLEEIEDDFPMDVFTSDSPIDVTCRDQDGRMQQLSVKAHNRGLAQHRIDRPENRHLRDFFQDRFERHAGLTWHHVGEACCWLIKATSLYGEIKRLMQDGITIYSSPSDLTGYQQQAGEDSGSEPR